MYLMMDCEQGSEEWFQARLGKFTASVFDKVLTKTGKLSSQSDELINRLVAELIIGEPDETFQSDAMERGKELESEALGFVNLTYDLSLEPCGFASAGKYNDQGEFVEYGYGCSADAIDEVEEIGLELKCPSPHKHLAYLAKGELPTKYFAQVQGSMMVTGFKKWIFCSYHPLLESLVIEVERDDEYIEKLREAVLDCCEKVKEQYDRLKELTETGLAG